MKVGHTPGARAARAHARGEGRAAAARAIARRRRALLVPQDMFEKNGFHHDKMEVVPYGLEPDRIEAQAVERPREPFRLAFCGVLSPWKAPGLAINAVRMIDADLELRIWGNTEEEMFANYIQGIRRSAEGDARIQFAGPYSGEQASNVFAEMDALVVPCTWYENTPSQSSEPEPNEEPKSSIVSPPAVDMVS